MKLKHILMIIAYVCIVTFVVAFTLTDPCDAHGFNFGPAYTGRAHVPVIEFVVVPTSTILTVAPQSTTTLQDHTQELEQLIMRLRVLLAQIQGRQYAH